MEIRSLAATFGRLNNEILELKPGLNVIEAANESGKSTWMAFLRVMLYGLNTRDRSAAADKRRFLPWNGSAMQGRMDVTSSAGEITISRTTARASSPMGAFSACYTGTSTSVDGLTSADCGESLLDIPSDIFERSAFIRQSGIAFDQTATLEKRITSLITTGEEDSSYTDAADRLRKQLNRRRHNKTGLLPQLEIEISALEDKLSEITSLETMLHTYKTERDQLAKQESALNHQLELCTAAENAQRVIQLNNARDALSAAAATLDSATALTSHLPSKEDLTHMTGDLSAAAAMQDSIRNAHLRMQDCSDALSRSETLLNAHPFAPNSPKDAAAAFTPADRPAVPRWTKFLSVFFAALIPLLYYLCVVPLPLSIVITLASAGMYLGSLLLIDKRRRNHWETETAQAQLLHQKQVDAYALLFDDAAQKRSAYQAAQDAYRTLDSDCCVHLNHLLSRVQRFGNAATIDEARRTIADALSKHSALDAARQQFDQAQIRFDALSENAPSISDIPSEAPALSREQAEERLQQVHLRLADLQRALHTAEGRCDALGDRLLLQAELDELQARRESIQKEYNAIELASRILSEANTALQTRFSPALGEKAANIFTKLTKGKYNKVLLDRELTPSAQEAGDMLPHEALLLSQGAADQLYLALRLAICDLILPEGVPLMLDDALVTFDDSRMAAALDHLVELSEKRQILLFTCQHRERDYLSSAHPNRFHAVYPHSIDTII